MTVAEVIHPGDKIEVNQLRRADTPGDISAVYRSKVLDVKENGNVEISMPTEKGRLVLLTLGVRYEFVFFSKGSLYRAIAQVKERYKKDNIFMLEIEFRSQLEKFQRREYYRYPCIMNFDYYLLTQEEAEYGTGEAVYVQIQNGVFPDKEEQTGQIIDLSGGGVRFIAEEEMSEGQYLLMQLCLTNEEISKKYYIVGTVIASQKTTRGSKNCYEIRMKFLIQDNNIREEIIKYIFEEERKTRQRSKR